MTNDPAGRKYQNKASWVMPNALVVFLIRKILVTKPYKDWIIAYGRLSRTMSQFYRIVILTYPASTETLSVSINQKCLRVGDAFVIIQFLHILGIR